jgi:alpha-glucosidase
VRYHVRKLWYRLRFGRYRLPQAAAASGYVRPGPVTGYRRRDQTVTVDCANGSYVLTVLAPEVIRVRCVPASRDAESQRTSYAVATPDTAWPRCELDVEETDAALALRTARLTCRIARASGRLTFLDAEGALINEDAAGVGYVPKGRETSAGAVICQKRIQPDEHFYGLGERASGLDRRGRAFATWNSDPQTYELDQDPLYLCIPFLLGLHGSGQHGYGIFFDNSWRGRFDLGADCGDVASFAAVGGEICYTFIYGPALSSVVDRYTALTGRTPQPPLWSLGYHQSRWSYYPEGRVRQLGDDFRCVHDVPCDAIHLDIHMMDGYRCFTWDPEGFPDPAGLIADLHEQGFKVVVILDAGIKADRDYSVCRSGLENDFFCALPDGTPVKGPVWPGDSYFPDFTAPEVRSWWGDLLRTMTDVGVDGIWNDMNEPAVFGFEGTTLPDAARHDLDGRGGDHAEAHNVYGLQMARATAEGLARLRPDRRPFSITRSGWAGVQRYAAGWTGDNRATWDQLWLTMPMVMNLGLSGLAFTGPDTGGFLGRPTGELFTRWLEMSTFLPFFRTHTHLHDADQEPWSWGEPWLTINRRWIEHRYRLLPYLYAAFWQCARTGTPIARPLLLAFQDDPVTYTLDDQFMCGDHLLVAPIVEAGATQRSVYLPAGTWYDVWSDERLTGPTWVEAQAPLERIPVFVRAGAVVPLAPVRSYVGERSLDHLTLHVYPAAGDQPGEHQSMLYEDDGQTYAYQDGDFLLTQFTLGIEGEPSGQLRLERETEGSYRPTYDTFEVVIHGMEHPPSSIRCDREPMDADAMGGSPPVLRLEVGRFEDLVLR